MSGLKRRQWEPFAFASPSLVLIAVVIMFPLVYSFYLSFMDFDLSVGPDSNFIGVRNYTESLFRDGRFLGSIWNTGVIIGPALVAELLLGLGLALLLSRVARGPPIITLPLLKFTMAVGLMIRLIDLTKLFGLIFVLTYGGPGSSTETVAFTTYLAGFKDFRMSYAAALSYVIVGGVLILTLLFLWIQRLREARAA